MLRSQLSQSENASVARTARRGALGVLLFWLALLATLYFGFDAYQSRQAERFKSYTSTTGELVIPRGPDGHFHVDGEINGHPVRFLVDTGASMVSVTDAFAEQARLLGGTLAVFQTANGEREGRILRDVPVRVGSLAAKVRLGVGVTANSADEGLLGQSFLRQFDVQISQNQMVLKAR